MFGEQASDIAAEFSQLGRNRRPPRDPLNALLSFCYSMLTKDLVAVTLGVGLDPYLGVYHRSRYGRPSLALDLAEEFRPLIADSVVIALLNNGEITSADFIRRAGAVSLMPDARRTVLRAYERRLDAEVKHPMFGYRISYRRVLDLQARLLAATIVGEIPTYPPMVTR
jgi:CRISPR-associated protein Cas1